MKWLQLYPASPFHFQPTIYIKDTLMLRLVHIENKKRKTNMINCFCSYVIKLAGETAKKVLLSVI